MKGAALLALVLIVHFAVADQAASWWFYVARGVEGAILFLLVARHCTGLAALACYLGAWEEASTAVCGYIERDNEITGPLCLQAFGPWPYAILAATAIVYLWSRRDRQN